MVVILRFAFPFCEDVWRQKQGNRRGKGNQIGEEEKESPMK